MTAYCCHASNNRINPTAACESRAPRRDTKYSDRGWHSFWRAVRSLNDFEVAGAPVFVF